MTPGDFVYALILPVAGWAWKVEQRLMKLGSIEEKVKETNQDVKDIYKHLIGARDEAERQDRS